MKTFEEVRKQVNKAIATRPLYKGSDWKEAFVARAEWVCWYNGWKYEDYIKERDLRYSEGILETL